MHAPSACPGPGGGGAVDADLCVAELRTALRSLRRAGQIPRFAPREHEVLTHLVQGRKVRTIAARLCLSVKTVEQHVLHIREKTRLTCLQEVIVFAVWWSWFGWKGEGSRVETKEA